MEAYANIDVVYDAYGFSSYSYGYMEKHVSFVDVLRKNWSSGGDGNKVSRVWDNHKCVKKGIKELYG